MPKAKQYYTDPMGDRVPARHVKPYDRRRDRIALRIAKLWEEENDRLAKLKAVTFELIEQLQTVAANDAGVPELGGRNGNVQFRSFDGSITVSLDCAKKTEFDERLALAQALIMEAVHEITDGVQKADLVEIATRAFQPRSSGNLDMQRVRDLRSYNVKHPKWVKACGIIADCERVIGHRRYVRVTVRKDRDSKPEPIVLDIAAVGLPEGRNNAN